MGYIRFVLSARSTDEQSNATRAVISRIESDMADTSMLETNLIMHALSVNGGKAIDRPLTLNIGVLDKDYLG